MNDFEVKEIITILISLYAVVPSIIITVMYNFLSNIEKELSDNLVDFFKLKESKEEIKKVDAIDKFVVVSSKILHVSMAYYLTQLFSSLLSECFKAEHGVFILIPRISTLFFIAYFIFYYFIDIKPSLKSVFIKEERLYEIGNIFSNIYFWLFYGILPLGGFILFITQNDKEMHWHLIWISITIFHLLFWWLIIPQLFKPLTNLSNLKRIIAEQTKYNDLIELIYLREYLPF